MINRQMIGSPIPNVMKDDKRKSALSIIKSKQKNEFASTQIGFYIKPEIKQRYPIMQSLAKNEQPMKNILIPKISLLHAKNLSISR